MDGDTQSYTHTEFSASASNATYLQATPSRQASRRRSPSPRSFSSVAESKTSVAKREAHGEEGGGSEKRRKKTSMLNLKTTNESKLVTFSKDILEESRLVTFEQLWSGEVKQRDVNDVITRVSTAANKCAGIVGEELKADAACLADELIVRADCLQETFPFLMMRKKTSPVD